MVQLQNGYPLTSLDELDLEAFWNVKDEAEEEYWKDVGDCDPVPGVDSLALVVVFHWPPDSPVQKKKKTSRTKLFYRGPAARLV